MAGHSHWAGIKHKKAINDKKKGKVFSKLVKLINTAVKEGGGGNPDDNPRLRLIIDKCRLANMPKDNVKRAIDKALAPGGGFEPVTFEAYGPGGAAVVVECLTDNNNRTGPEVRRLIERAGAKLGKPGCVLHMFQRKAVFNVEADKASEEKLMEVALEAGAEDIVDQGGFFEVTAPATAFVPVATALTAAGIETSLSEIQLVPDSRIPVGLEDAQKLMKLTEVLEEHDDVQDVYSNFDVSEEAAAALAAEEA